MSEQIEYVDPREIKRDEYQPRLTFGGIDELARSFEDDQQYDPVHVDANNYLIDGERRWRAAMKLGVPLKAIRHDVDTVEGRDAIRDSLGAHKEEITIVERAWNYLRRVIKINTGVDYTPQELQKMKAKDYEQLQTFASDMSERDDNGKQKSGGFSELARQLTKRGRSKFDRQTITSQTMIIFVSPELLDKIEKDEVGITYGREIARLYKTPQLMKQVEQELLADLKLPSKDRKYTRDLLNQRVTEYQKELERKVEEEAQIIREKQETDVEPEVDEPSSSTDSKPVSPPPEIPDDLVSDKVKEEAAKPPKPKKTDREKAEAALIESIGKGSSAEAKIGKARKINIDVSEELERLEEAINKINSDPELAWEEGKQLKKDVDAKIKKAKQTEEQKNAIAEAEEKARREEQAKAQKKFEEERAKLAEKLREEIKEEVIGQLQTTENTPSNTENPTMTQDLREIGQELGKQMREAFEQLDTGPNIQREHTVLKASLLMLIKQVKTGNLKHPTDPKVYLIWSNGDTLQESLEKLEGFM